MLKMIELFIPFGMRHDFLYSINTNKNETTYNICYLLTGAAILFHKVGV